MWLWTARLPASTTSASARPSPVARRAAARRATPKGSRPTFGFQEENSQPSPRAWSSRQLSSAASIGPVPGTIRLAPRRRAARATAFQTSAAQPIAAESPPSSW